MVDAAGGARRPLVGENQPFAGFRFGYLPEMRTVSPVNLGELLNTVGLSLGVVLYTMLLAMVVRTRRATGITSTVDPLLLLTSVLGLVWNLCALAVYLLPRLGVPGPFPFVSAVGFGALGLLPA